MFNFSNPITKSFLKASFSTSKSQPWQKLSRCAVFSSKPYDIKYFDQCNSNFEPKQQVFLEYHTEGLNDKTAKFVQGFDTVCVFVNDKVDAKCLEVLRANGVDLIALRCAGFNNIDMKRAKELGIRAVRVPAYSPYAVAEHAMSLLQCINRKLHKAYNRTKESNFSLDGLVGVDLHGKNIGIIGAGKIGRVFAKICTGYEMNIKYFDIQENEEMNKIGGKLVTLDELFHESDFISLHCPLTPETKYIIDTNSIHKMKKGVILVNTGRGGLIHSKAVISALKKKKIGGLALDVYEQEENLFFNDKSLEIMDDDELSRLLSFPNVIVTGHQAFFTKEALTNICDTTLRNIMDIRATGKSPNLVEI